MRLSHSPASHAASTSGLGAVHKLHTFSVSTLYLLHYLLIADHY